MDMKLGKVGTTLGEYLPKGIRVVPILPIGRVPKLKSWEAGYEFRGTIHPSHRWSVLDNTPKDHDCGFPHEVIRIGKKPPTFDVGNGVARREVSLWEHRLNRVDL